MKATMAIPSYWGRPKAQGWQEGDLVFDHPTPLDEEGTLRRAVESIEILENKDFNLVVLGAATSPDIAGAVGDKISEILGEARAGVEVLVFTQSHLARIHDHLNAMGKGELAGLLSLGGYSSIRNLCVFLPHLLGSETAVLIDDDELFEDPAFMDKALAFIGRETGGRRVLAVAGYYINPDGDYMLNREVLPWMTSWDKIGSMNRAFETFIGTGPRLKETPFAFGGNLVIHRDLFTEVPFDPGVPRGEDIDFLMNARMFGHSVFIDRELAIKHDPPAKSHSKWMQVREDIYRFVFEKAKLDAQEEMPGMRLLRAEALDPYPGEFLKDDLDEMIFRSNSMLATDYLMAGETRGAGECMRNIHLAAHDAPPRTNPFKDLLALQKAWRELMACFSDEENARAVLDRIGWSRG